MHVSKRACGRGCCPQGRYDSLTASTPTSDLFSDQLAALTLHSGHVKLKPPGPRSSEGPPK